MGILYLTPNDDRLTSATPPAKPRGNWKDALTVLAPLAFVGGLPSALRFTPKPERKCALPGCEKMGTKDYCCAEHCAEHRRLDRERRAHE